jgi:hypothetical protein
MTIRRSVHNQCPFEHCFQSSYLPVAECCVKSHKDREVIVPHNLICMTHGLVLTSHLQDKLVWTCQDQQMNSTPVLLDGLHCFISFELFTMRLSSVSVLVKRSLVSNSYTDVW